MSSLFTLNISMNRIIVLFLTIIVVGCATRPAPIPMPAPIPTNFCGPNETKDCREYTTGDKGGTPVRGHSETTKDPL